MEYRIREGRKEDAEFIANAVMAAIGMDVCSNMAVNHEQRVLRQAFVNCAARDDSQYSYRNTLVAVDADGDVAGVVVGYDGADMHRLRCAFVDEYNHLMGTSYKEEEWSDETTPDEIYLDTLAVAPEHRKHGVGTLLVKAFCDRYANVDKPVGLLVDYDNANAKRLYVSRGFEPVGERSFFGTPMEHLQLGVRSKE